MNIKLLSFILFIFLLSLIKLDSMLVLKRNYNLTQKINLFYTKNDDLPNSLSALNLKLNGNISKESFCDMLELNLEGIGYCYYTKYENKNYAIQIYSYFHIIIYNSENNKIVKKIALFSNSFD